VGNPVSCFLYSSSPGESEPLCDFPIGAREIATRIKENSRPLRQNRGRLPFRQDRRGNQMQAIHACNHTTAEALYPFDARGIAKRFRHAAIFGALDALMPGETMRFCNDHDPLPLLAQLQARYGERLSITYQQREPGAIVIDFAVVS
jgi:uncharacterized protein (DUF2249 family)